MPYKFIFIIYISIFITACSNDNVTNILIKNGCSVDNIIGSKLRSENKNYIFNNGDSLILQGWFADISNDVVPSNIQLVAYAEDGRFYSLANGQAGGVRQDVGDAFGKKNVVKSGINIPFKIENLQYGNYQLQISGNFSKYNGLCLPNVYFEIK